MDERRYDFYIDGYLAAENMTLEAAMLLSKAAFETYHAMPTLEISVKRRAGHEANPDHARNDLLPDA